MLYDWSMDSNCSTEIQGSKTDVACAGVDGANTTPLLVSVAHFAKRQIIIGFLLLQNTQSRGEFLKSKPPARNPPAFLPRPPLRAGKEPRQGKTLPPDKLSRPAESALVILIVWTLLKIHSNFVQ